MIIIVHSVICGQLTDPANGQVEVNGSKAIYTCNSNYIIKGNNSRDCLLSGNWSGSEPICNTTEPETTPGFATTEPETTSSFETSSSQPDLGTVVGSVVAVSVVLISLIVILIVIVCCVRRYLKRELQIPTMGPETIVFGKIKR